MRTEVLDSNIILRCSIWARGMSGWARGSQRMQQALNVFTRPRVWITGVVVLFMVGLVSYFGATTNCAWLREFSANLAAGTSIAIVFGVLATIYFQSSRETAERQARQAEAYGLLRKELDENLQRLDSLRKAWLNNELLLFTFQTGQGRAILQDSAILGEDLEFVSLVFNTYEQMEFLNRYYTILLEEPIRSGIFELRLGLQRISVKNKVDEHLERLDTLITKALNDMPQNGKPP